MGSSRLLAGRPRADRFRGSDNSIDDPASVQHGQSLPPPRVVGYTAATLPLAQRPMKPSLVALLLVSAIAVGCGDDPPTAPTRRSLYTETSSEVIVQALSSGCVTFRQEAAGPASVSVLSGKVPIELGTGTCTIPGPVVGRATTGQLAVQLAVGDHYLRFENRFNTDFTFRVTLHYLVLV